MLTINNTFSRRKRSRIYLRPGASDFCDNHSPPASPASLFLTSPRPRPTRPRVPYLMSSSPSSRVPTSQVPTHASHVPVPLSPSHFYTQPFGVKAFEYLKEWHERSRPGRMFASALKKSNKRRFDSTATVVKNSVLIGMNVYSFVSR